jgi:ABC-type spermidine/putrescine transport system permease subunit II
MPSQNSTGKTFAPYALLAPLALVFAAVLIGVAGSAIFALAQDPAPQGAGLYQGPAPPLPAAGLFSLISALLSVAVSVAAVRALLLYDDFRGRRLFLLLASMRALVPAALLAVFLHSFFTAAGADGAAPALILLHTVCSLPLAMGVMSRAASAQCLLLEEHARALGAKGAGAFLHGFMPPLARGLLAAGALSFMLSFAQSVAAALARAWAVAPPDALGGGAGQAGAALYYAIVFMLPTIFALLVFLAACLAFSSGAGAPRGGRGRKGAGHGA